MSFMSACTVTQLCCMFRHHMLFPWSCAYSRQVLPPATALFPEPLQPSHITRLKLPAGQKSPLQCVAGTERVIECHQNGHFTGDCMPQISTPGPVWLSQADQHTHPVTVPAHAQSDQLHAAHQGIFPPYIGTSKCLG